MDDPPVPTDDPPGSNLTEAFHPFGAQLPKLFFHQTMHGLGRRWTQDGCAENLPKTGWKCVFFSGDTVVGCTPTNLPLVGNPYISPYSSWVCMGEKIPKNPIREHNRYHGDTARGTPKCPLILKPLQMAQIHGFLGSKG